MNTTGDVRAEDGQCSLREAIIAANTDTASGVTPGECSAGSGSDVIALGAQTYTLTIGGVSEDSGLTGDLDVTANLTINGAGLAQTIIDGGGLDQVIEVMHNVNLSLNGLSIQNGFGGFSGGISNEGLLTLSGVSVSNNDGIGIGSAHDWANPPPYPAVDLINSIVAGNTSTGIHSINTTLVLDQSIVDGNQDGGIFASESVTIVDSTISENSSSSTGGGIAIINGYSDVIVRSTINGNTATGDGGGIYFWGFTVGENHLVLENVTLSGNQAGGNGGGLIVDSGSGSEVMMFNVSIVNNTADYDHNNDGDGGGTYNHNGARLYMQNSLLATNVDSTTSGSKVPDCSGALQSGGYNLIGAVDGVCTITGITTGNQTGTIPSPLDPVIGELEDNGGPTDTHALLIGSPTIDAGNPAGCTDLGAAVLPEDQRWWARHIDSNLDGTATCDIGAYEKTLDLYMPLINR